MDVMMMPSESVCAVTLHMYATHITTLVSVSPKASTLRSEAANGCGRPMVVLCVAPNRSAAMIA